MKVLVVGGAGFVGTYLVKRLCEDGHDVTVLDNLRTGDLNNLREINKNHLFKFILGDICDESVVRQAMKGIEYVFHLAALVSVQESIEHPDIAIDINIKGTLTVLKAAAKAGVKRVIYSSSSAVYGLDTISSMNPYAMTKMVGEQLCYMYFKNAIVLRYFNIYGPGQNLNSQYSAVIPRFIKKALRGEDLHIYGTGEQSRDFIFVEDVVEANILAMKMGKIPAHPFDIGICASFSINTLAHTIIRLTGSRSKICYLDGRDGEVFTSCANIEYAFPWRDSFGVTPLEEGLKKTIDYYRNKLAY